MSVLGKLQFLQSLLQGEKTNRKIVVIESDDWGSERIPNNTIREQLKDAGINVESNPHSKFDTLERLEDLEVLESLLLDIENQYGKKVRITTNFITANPDFSQIATDKFKKYSYEPFCKTYSNRDGNNQVIEKLKSLISDDRIMPQFHGREHINAGLWTDVLQSNNDKFVKAFNLGCYAIDASTKAAHRKNLMAAFEYENKSQEQDIIISLQEGMQIFDATFGFRSSTIIAPRYIWKPKLEESFQAEGIKYIQTSFYQQEPIENGYKNIYHFTGQSSSSSNLRYLVRNAYFEPAYQGNVDWVNATLKNVQLAFRFKTPAIISMHRINFVGGLNAEVRDENIKQFKSLLVKIIKKYPDVEFMTSDKLGNLITAKYVRN